MAEKVKKGHGEHGLKMTQGEFKLRGFATSTKKDSFFKQTAQKNGFERNTVNFGVKTSPNNEVYVQISESEREDAWFYKSSSVKGEKGTSKKVPWGQRKNFKDEGFTPIGVTVGLEKDEDNKNIKINMFEYDTAEYLSEHVVDDMPVLVIGELEFSSSDGKDGKNRYKKLKIKKIFNSALDFEKEDFKEESHFKQKCLFLDINQAKKDGKADMEDPRWIISAKIVTYKGLEDVEFVLRNKSLANNFKKRLKAYNCIEVYGKISNKRNEEIVEVSDSDDGWGGDTDPFENVNSPRKFEFEITGINAKDIDTKTYSEQIVTEAFRADDEFGSELDSDDTPWSDDDDEDLDW